MTAKNKQRVVIGMVDGLGMDYFDVSPIPMMKDMAEKGFFKRVKAAMPSVTNVNNVSICCGAWPKDHGITGNSYFNETTGEEDYMENADFIRIPTIIQRAAWHGVKSVLLTCKKKTINLLAGGAEIAIAAEDPPAGFIQRYGKPADIYSREINYWLWKVAVDILKNRPDIGLLYIHTTDYPMHAWSPAEAESKEHLGTLDSLLGEARDVASDAAFYITADHGMNYKKRCWDLAKACLNRGVELRYFLSAEKDRYIKHHRTFGGTAWIWLKSSEDVFKATEIISGLKGVEEVLTREEAASRFNLMPDRIGELVVLGDTDTVFGEMETETEALEPTYRSHGSLHELDVPLVIYNQSGDLLPADDFRTNLDLTRTLYR